jgi:multiple sugar transport system permease protein
MNAPPQAVVAGPIALSRTGPPRWRLRLRNPEMIWVVAFIVPYAAVFVAFVAYPVGYGILLASNPSLYHDLLADPLYARTVVNTLLFVTLAVNVKIFLALLLSGFFMRRRWWVRALLTLYILPWALPAIPAFVSFHWMLIGEYGLLNSLLSELFGIDGPIWFNDRWLALGANIVSYIWKWLPFWTLVFLAGRMAIPREIYEAAAVDGAGGLRRFLHIVCPLLANMYLACVLLSTLWTVGEFTSVLLVSGGAPAHATEVLATLGVHYAFDIAEPPLGVAAVLSALPLLIPFAVLLVRRLDAKGVQL